MTLGNTTTATSGAGSVSTLPIAWPSGAADGDLAVLFFSNERAAVFPTLSTMLPGWTTSVGGDASAADLIAYKYIVPSDLTAPVTIGTLTSPRRCNATLTVLPASGTPTIVNGTIVAATGGGAAVAVTPAISASAANGIELSAISLRSSAVGGLTGLWTRTVTPASGWTEIVDLFNTAANANSGIHLAWKAVTASGAQATANQTTSDNNTQIVPHAIYIPDGVTRLSTPVVSLGAKTDATTVGGSDGTQQVSWLAVSGATSYTVEVASGAGATTGFTTKSTTAVTPYTVTGLAAGTYTIGVTAVP